MKWNFMNHWKVEAKSPKEVEASIERIAKECNLKVISKSEITKTEFGTYISVVKFEEKKED